MKFLILGGFLGSGKTTLLMQLARYLTRESRENGPSQVKMRWEIPGWMINF